MRPQICHCGHDKATHHEGKHACCGLGCDPECRFFIDREHADRPERTKAPSSSSYVRPPWLGSFMDRGRKNKPHVSIDCNCSDCYRWYMYS